MQGSQVMSLSVLNVGFSLPPSLSLPPLRGLRKRTSGVFRKRTEQTGASAWIQLDWEMAVQIALHYLTPVSVQWGWKPASANCWKRNCQYYDGNKSLILPFFWVLHVHRGEWAEGWISVVLSRCLNMGHVSVSFSCRHFKDTCLVTKSTWTPKMNLHFLPLMMYCCIPGRKKNQREKNKQHRDSKRDRALMNLCYFFCTYTVPSSLWCPWFHQQLIYWATFRLGNLCPLWGKTAIVIRADTGTYKAEDPEGTSRTISAGKGYQSLCCRGSSPPITMKQDKQTLHKAISLQGERSGVWWVEQFVRLWKSHKVYNKRYSMWLW